VAHVAKLTPAREPGRIELAAAFRLAARFGWHEAVANHFSLAISDDGRRVLINPRWKHFARIRASDLLELAVDDPAVMARADAPDPTAWCIHGTIHKMRPEIRCLLHVHSPYATALVALEDSRIRPIDQNTARFYQNVAYDDAYEGLALAEEEGRRLADALGDKSILMMANHGVLVTGPSVAQAFDDLYYLERACQTLVLAYATGRPLRLISDNVAGKVAAEWAGYEGFAEAHFGELLALLDAEDPTYAD
jgi:ribulose-5-phosphate 4-epimerase/fuculose-1-phosphate aldolase